MGTGPLGAINQSGPSLLSDHEKDCLESKVFDSRQVQKRFKLLKLSRKDKKFGSK
jgi:hypothetical protein